MTLLPVTPNATLQQPIESHTGFSGCLLSIIYIKNNNFMLEKYIYKIIISCLKKIIPYFEKLLIF